MKQKIRQIIYDIRRQPVIGSVTIIATALSIFLFMVVAITSRVSVVPFAPESCRDRLLIADNIHFEPIKEGGTRNGFGLCHYTAKKLYGGLDGVENMAIIRDWLVPHNVNGSTEKSFEAETRDVDAAFFRIFDHTLISGRYFTDEEAYANMPVVVISESTARKAFGTTECEGKTLVIDQKEYTVTGVVKDSSLLATHASGDIFIATGPETASGLMYEGDENMAPYMHYASNHTAILLVKEDVDFDYIRKQVKARYAEFNTELKSIGYEVVYHDSPYDQKTVTSGEIDDYSSPDFSRQEHERYLLYAILLILPAINLSTLLHSRMRRRVNEIGIRRAFGCTRSRVIVDIISENFLLTLVGGIIGVGIGITFALTYSGLYESRDTVGLQISPALSAVINIGTILIAVAVCFILNLISAFVPAWQASRLNPVEAINAK